MPTILPQPIASQSSKTGWDFIDKIYCISLEHRLDRQQQAREQFARVGLADRVAFVIGKKHPTNAELGNFIAHMNCLNAGLAAGAQRIAVFEDDIQFERFSELQLNRAAEFMRSGEPWNALFFGCFVRSSRRTKYPSVLKIKFKTTTHAYVFSRAFAEKLVQIPWPGRCLDDLLCSLNDPRMYAVYPAFAFQSDSPTDNDKQIAIDRLRRALGGIRRLQKVNEFFSVNLWRLVVVHVIAVVGVIAIYFAWR
jgi:hypothetical protein